MFLCRDYDQEFGWKFERNLNKTKKQPIVSYTCMKHKINWPDVKSKRPKQPQSDALNVFLLWFVYQNKGGESDLKVCHILFHFEVRGMFTKWILNNAIKRHSLIKI